MQVNILSHIRQIWDPAPTLVTRSVNSANVCANWRSVQHIVEAEQSSANGVEYGKALLNFFDLLRSIRYALPDLSNLGGTWQIGTLHTGLSCIHYQNLLKLELLQPETKLKAKSKSIKTLPVFRRKIT
jgi:hypothetical protein